MKYLRIFIQFLLQFSIIGEIAFMEHFEKCFFHTFDG